jgi:hypothetical protein
MILRIMAALLGAAIAFSLASTAQASYGYSGYRVPSYSIPNYGSYVPSYGTYVPSRSYLPRTYGYRRPGTYRVRGYWNRRAGKWVSPYSRRYPCYGCSW